ncbi:molybdenum cofactor guanylyltransferase [Cohnella luojiensis]|uniref:Probable molybdenum cofactor guanylyltransferase n=1 Tax=Cohnella luojiensis TaxID=652876 RepID=A0A4Y8M6X3_9BACL|nr:molybdenum cofactor guanylyltransferase [Cohnella luojiensis]TFE31572.1 molybdenum cofactor guanylyltransferase [Cohnella luojiensis]
MDRTAVILAGGQGQRMGGVNKAFLSLGNERFIERQIRVVREWTDEIIVVSNDEHYNSQLKQYIDIRIVRDVYEGEGPLAGFHAGVSAATRSNVWVLGCDQPFPDAAAAEYLQTRLDGGAFQAAIPLMEGRPQPLHAIYRKETGIIAEKLLKAGERKFLALLDHFHWCGIEEGEFIERGISLVFNHDVDTPEQHEKANFLFSEEK